ncbi:YqcC family protein [Marinomonas agarivorans]|nr:YqcC family protein [Marinomonas agarivorans]
MEKYHQLADLLLELEMMMRQEALWDIPMPSPEAFMSQEPFCIDTMSFSQWVKFVMLERYKQIIEQKMALPPHSEIAPIADMYFQQQTESVKRKVLTMFMRLDRFINDQNRMD